MTPIRTNKPVFFGDAGEVLKDGFVYIGEANKDPRSFPKLVTFKDAAGAELTAAQPLRTNRQGQISYNGKAIIAQVDGGYSMLVLNSAGAQVKDGYTPLIIVDSADTGGTGVILSGLLLTDIKALPVTPGDTVENTGKVTAEDGLGATWLVVSSTGSPADDVDLINFDNGTQGKRVNNVRYTKDTVTIAQGGTGGTTAAVARTNLDVHSKADVYTKTQGDGRYISSNPSTIISENIDSGKVSTKVAFAAGEAKSISVQTSSIADFPLVTDRYIKVFAAGTTTEQSAAYIAEFINYTPGHQDSITELAYVHNSGTSAVDVEFTVTRIRGS